jgi:hypothetical protein
MGEYAFGPCQMLESITIPSRVEVIGRECFVWCLRLFAINFLSNSRLVRIESRAFSQCQMLQSLVIPSSVEHVGEYCFEACTSLSGGFSFASPSHVRELMDLPLAWQGFHDIPDSVQVLRFDYTTEEIRGVTELRGLTFGRESRLVSVKVRRRVPFDLRAYFLQFTSRSLKMFRSVLEFGETVIDC